MGIHVNWNNRFGSNLLFGCAKRENVKNNIDHDCVLMTDKEHRDHYWMAVAHYNKLIEEGEEEQLAKDKTNKWAVVSNKDINGNFVCWFSFLLL